MGKNKLSLCIKECKKEIKEYFISILAIVLFFFIPAIFFIFCIILGGYYILLAIILVIFVYIPSIKCFDIYAKYNDIWRKK